jgi:hypothetical protein
VCKGTAFAADVAKQRITAHFAILQIIKQARRLSLLASKKTADRKLDTRRKIIIGAAVLAHAELDPHFSATLRGILSVAVQRDIDRHVIADLLDVPPAPVVEHD